MVNSKVSDNGEYKLKIMSNIGQKIRYQNMDFNYRKNRQSTLKI